MAQSTTAPQDEPAMVAAFEARIAAGESIENDTLGYPLNQLPK